MTLPATETAMADPSSTLTAEPTQAPASAVAAVRAALVGRAIVLIGMMGAGKSSIGRRLASTLDIPFVDADVEIEKAAGMSIPDIFESQGEDYFRAGEARVIARLLDGGPLVLATGGRLHERADAHADRRARLLGLALGRPRGAAQAREAPRRPAAAEDRRSVGDAR